MRMKLILAALASVTAVATPALAQDTFGTKNDFAFAADRLTGVYLFKQGGYEATVLGLLQAPSGQNVYNTARIGFDWFPIDRLSLGGSLSYWSVNVNEPADVTTKEFLFAPRVGYTLPIGKAFGIWPRGGFSFRSTKVGEAPSAAEWAFTAELQFYASPAPHFAFIFGPVFDIGFAGDYDDKARNIGLLTGGIMGWI